MCVRACQARDHLRGKAVGALRSAQRQLAADFEPDHIPIRIDKSGGSSGGGGGGVEGGPASLLCHQNYQWQFASAARSTAEYRIPANLIDIPNNLFVFFSCVDTINSPQDFSFSKAHSTA